MGEEHALELSSDGRLLFALAFAGSLLVAVVLSIVARRTALRVLVLAAGPVAAVIVFQVVDPEPGCTSCARWSTWVFATATGTVGWIAGCGLAAAGRAIAHRRARARPG